MMFSDLKPALIGCGLVLCVVACSQAPQADAAAQEQASEEIDSAGAGAQSVTIDSIEVVRADPVEEQLVTCSHTNANGNKITNFFVLTEGVAKSYSSFQNYARNLCDPGQPDCAQGWIGDKIGSYSVNQSGIRNQFLVDLEAMTMERAMTRADGSVELSQYQCTSEPLPDGITIE